MSPRSGLHGNGGAHMGKLESTAVDAGCVLGTLGGVSMTILRTPSTMERLRLLRAHLARHFGRWRPDRRGDRRRHRRVPRPAPRLTRPTGDRDRTRRAAGGGARVTLIR